MGGLRGDEDFSESGDDEGDEGGRFGGWGGEIVYRSACSIDTDC